MENAIIEGLQPLCGWKRVEGMGPLTEEELLALPEPLQ